jgi:hypothetical protein
MEINETIIELLNGNFMVYFYILLIILSNFIINTFFMLTNYYYSPTHRNICDTIETINYLIKSILNENEKKEIIYFCINIIGMIFILFACLMYNKIIICHFCNLDLNTGNQIHMRSKIETKIINIENATIINEEYE